MVAPGRGWAGGREKWLPSWVSHPIRAPASPCISMPLKLGLPHTSIRRALSHKRDSHSRTAQARGVLPTTCTQRMHGFGFCVSAARRTNCLWPRPLISSVRPRSSVCEGSSAQAAAQAALARCAAQKAKQSARQEKSDTPPAKKKQLAGSVPQLDLP